MLHSILNRSKQGEQTMPNSLSWIPGVVAALLLGIAFLFPLQLVREHVNVEGAWGPLIKLGLMAATLFVPGILLGLGFSKRSSLGAWHTCLLGLLVMVPVIILHAASVIADVNKDPTSHNLWPFEFVILAVGALVPVAGAYVGRSLVGGDRTRGTEDRLE